MILRHLASFIVLAVASALAAGCSIPARWAGGAVVRNGARPAARHCQCPLLRRRRSCPDDRRGGPCPRARAGGIARRRPPTKPMPPASFLAVSGGGDNGAFGAGLLNGWTAAGTRPEFKIVTGVSTGALIAPFAFLGPDYDAAAARGLHDDHAATGLPRRAASLRRCSTTRWPTPAAGRADRPLRRPGDARRHRPRIRRRAGCC